MKLTVAVDKVAASGGYMMACVADRILAAPFAVVGSIGVIAQLPNFNRLLKKNDVDYEQFMAGEFKLSLIHIWLKCRCWWRGPCSGPIPERASGRFADAGAGPGNP